MKKQCCPTCKTEIEIKKRFEKGEGLTERFMDPCNVCKHRHSDEDEMPCRFCTCD